MSEKNEWKPIESAPKDELILVGPTKRMGICVAMNHSRDGWVTETCNEWCSIYTPTHWMPLPAEPCLTCNGHGMIGGLTPHSGYDAEPCPDCSPAPTSHPRPTGATGEDEGVKDDTPAAWLLTNTRLGKTWASIVSPVPGEVAELGNEGIAAEPLYRRPAPAAGDALAALRELVECDSLKKRIASMQVCVLETEDDVQELDAMMSDLERRQPAAWDAARAALAAQVPQQGEA